tara:strand:+ start:347 stop:541 length:195 start_codon:yes stop_codon:yes gene_type:complete
MKYLLLISLVMLSGCSSIQICGERTYELEVPSTIPFISGAFKIKRSSDHVDCQRDPEDRAVKND